MKIRDFFKQGLLLATVFVVSSASIVLGMFVTTQRQKAAIHKRQQDIAKKKVAGNNVVAAGQQDGQNDWLEERERNKIQALLRLESIDAEEKITQELKIGDFRAQEQKKLPVVWIKTQEGAVVSIEKWKVMQMTLLKDFVLLHKAAGTKESPIDLSRSNISLEQLELLSHAFDALAKNDASDNDIGS